MRALCVNGNKKSPAGETSPAFNHLETTRRGFSLLRIGWGKHLLVRQALNSTTVDGENLVTFLWNLIKNNRLSLKIVARPTIS